MSNEDARNELKSTLERNMASSPGFTAARKDPIVRWLFAKAVEEAEVNRTSRRERLDWPYGSVPHFVLAHGRLAKGWRPLPSGTGLEYGEWQMCFENSLFQAGKPPLNLGYAEGYFATPTWNDIEPVLPHAWNTDSDGEVVDRTLRPRAVIRAEILAKHGRSPHPGELKDGEADAEVRYFGVGFDCEEVLYASIKTVGSFIDRKETNWPLLRDQDGIVRRVVRHWGSARP